MAYAIICIDKITENTGIGAYLAQMFKTYAKPVILLHHNQFFGALKIERTCQKL